MKTIICLLLLFSTPITIKLEYYNGEGVIFPKEYRNYNLGSPMPTYTPTINQVIRAEKIMHENYQNFKVKLFDSIYKNPKFDLKDNYPETFIKHFRNHNRQYSGYINENKDSIIFIGLLNLKTRIELKLHLTIGKKRFFYAMVLFARKIIENVK